jgi:hypothetical protein
MTKKIDLQNMNRVLILKTYAIEKAFSKLNESEEPLKKRWLAALTKASEVFLSENSEIVIDMHKKIETYKTTASDCECQASLHGIPCYHRAYVILTLRYSQETHPAENLTK